jgi:hypothetical protein
MCLHRMSAHNTHVNMELGIGDNCEMKKSRVVCDRLNDVINGTSTVSHGRIIVNNVANIRLWALP